MKIHEERKGAVTVIKPEGSFAAGDAGQFKTRLVAALTGSMGRFVVDASEIAFIDGEGLEVLVEVADDMGRIGRTLKLCAPSQTLCQVLALTGLNGLFEHHNDVNAGVRSFL